MFQPSSDLLLGLVAGGGVGFVGGYITNMVRQAKRTAEQAEAKADLAIEEVHEVKDHIGRDRDERGSIGDDEGTAMRGEKGDPGVDKDTPFQRKMVVVAVVFTAAAAIASGIAWTDSRSTLATANQRTLDNSNELADIDSRQEALDEDQADFKAQTNCLNDALAATLIALQARSQFAEEATRTNLRLINAQLDFLLGLIGQTSDVEAQKATQDYLHALRVARTNLHDQLLVRQRVPYPFIKAIRECAHVTSEDPTTETPLVPPVPEPTGG